MPRENYYPSLNGLRGVAIILVLLYHNFDFLSIFKYGWAGVDLFFVLSGFLITGILLRTINEKYFLKNFYIRRALRIMPIYYLAVLMFIVLVSLAERLSAQGEYYLSHQPFLWLNFQNWMYILFETPEDRMLMFHCWSLSLEEQFYLLWPLIILVLRKRHWLKVFLIFLLLAGIFSRIISWQIMENENQNFLLQSMTRVDGLVIGSLIAVYKSSGTNWTKKIIIICSSVLLLHLVAFAAAKIIFPFPHFRFLGYSSIAALFGLGLLYCIRQVGVISKTLSSGILPWFGKISYGLYLYHWPILVLFKIYLLEVVMENGVSLNNSYIIISLTALMAAILLAWVSYRYFERYFLSLKERFK